MKKSIVILVLAACLLLIISVVAIGNGYSLFPVVKDVKNVKYPEIVAKVGDKEITGMDLTRAVIIERAKWENVGQPQEESFYEKCALQQLIINTLLENSASDKGIFVSYQDAKDHLLTEINRIMMMEDSNTYKTDFIKYVKKMGYKDLNEYATSDEVIKATQKALSRLKLQETIKLSVPTPTISEITKYAQERGIKLDEKSIEDIKKDILIEKGSKAWLDFKQNLLKDKNYEILINIDIDNFDPGYKDKLQDIVDYKKTVNAE